MTNKEAIDILRSKMDGKTDTSYEWCECARMAIKALLEQEIVCMITASEARKLTNKAELEQIEKDLDWLDRQIRTTALDNYDSYDFCINHLSKSGRRLIKTNLEAAGYKVSSMTGVITNDAYYRIEW